MEVIKEHKYVTCEYTPVDKILDYYWNFLARIIPKVLFYNLVDKS